LIPALVPIVHSFSANVSLSQVFDGVKMAADISLNGQPLGHATNQFNRYIFSSTSNVCTLFFFKCIPHPSPSPFSYPP
jgi:hypothetical protein